MLPLAMLAANYNYVTVSWTPNSSSANFTGGTMALPTPTVTYRTGGNTYTLASSNYTVTWKYNGMEVNVADHAGTYTATITHAGDNWYSGNGTGNLGNPTRTYTVNRADNSVSAPSFAEGNTWEYGQTPHIPNSSALDGEIIFEISANGTGGWQSFSNLTATSAPNKWYVRARVAQTVDYNAATSSNTQIEITKATVTVTPGNETAEWRNPFEGIGMNYITPTVTGAVDWSVAKNYLKWKEVEPVTIAEQGYAYTLESNGSENDYYNFVVDGNGVVNITKNTKASVGGGSDGADQTYSGEALTLTPGTVLAYRDELNNEAGTVQYKIIAPAAAETEWLDEIPKVTDAATYTVIYKGVGDQNHTDSEDAAYTYEVTINPYELVEGTDFTAPTAKTDGVYTGSAQDIAIAGEFKGKFAEELDAAGAKFIYPTADALPQRTDANENYSFSWNIDLGTSTNLVYTASAKTVTGAKIAKAFITSADYTLPVVNPDLEPYNATNQNLHTALVWNVTPAPGEARYGRSDTPTQWPNTLRWRNDAGTWTISTAIIPDANHTFEAGTYLETVDISGQTAYVVQNDLEVTIEPADLTITNPGSVDTKVYNGNPQVLVAAAPTFSGPGTANVAGTVNYSWNDGVSDQTATNIADVVAENVGKYAITYTFAPTSTNFNAITENQALGGADAKAEITKATLNFGVNNLEVDWADGKTYEWAAIVKELVTSDDWLAGEDDAEKAAILSAALNITVNGGAADASNEDFVALLAGDAGIYNIGLTANDDAEGVNYKVKLYNNATKVTINKINATLAELENANPTYTGEEVELVTIKTAAVGAAEENGVLYIVGGDTAPAADSEAWTAGIPKKVDAGTYKVWQKVVGDKNHKDVVATSAFTATIAKANLADAAFTLNPAKVSYNGQPKTTEVVPTAPLKASDYDVVLPAEMVEANVYTITLNAKDEGSNYYGTKSAQFEIEAATDNAITDPVIAGWTYGQDPNAPSATATYSAADEPTYTYYFADGDDLGAEVGGVPTEAGDYFVVASVAATSDYNAIDSDPVKFTIAKADVAEGDITAAEAKKDLIYNNTDQVLIKEAKSSIGTFKYFIGEEAPDADSKDWSADITTITEKNAGTYTVWTLFVPDNNHNGVEPVSVPATINKVNLSYVLGNTEKVWNGATFTNEELKKAYTLTAGSLQGDDISEIPFDITMPKDAEGNDITDAGEYTFDKLVVDPAEPTNYNVNFTGTAKLTINKANLVEGTDFVAPAKVNTTYEPGIAAKPLAIEDEDALLTDYATAIVYAQADKAPAEDSELWGAIPTATDKGAYPVWYMVKGDKNHNNYIVPEALASSIAAAEIAKYLEPELLEGFTAVYSGAKQTFEITTDLVAYNEETKKGDYVIEPYTIKDVDSYNIIITGKNNYEGSSASIPVTITPANLMVTAPDAEKTYDATAVIEEAEFGEPIFNGLLGGDEIKLTGDPNNYVSITLGEDENGIDAGTYTLTLDPDAVESAIPAPKNYVVKAVLPGTLTINKVKSAKIGISKKYTKVYGAKDPEFTFGASDLTQEGIADNLSVIASQLKASRTDDGENVTEEGKGYKVQLALTDKATFQKNYESIEYGATIMSITPAKLTISIASASKTYDGNEPTIEEFGWAEDLSNMIVAGLPEGKDKAEIFTTDKLPTVSIVGASENAGKYNIELKEDYVTKNYSVTLLPGSYFTIDPIIVEAQFNNTYTTEVGASVADVLKSIDWTVVATDEEQIADGAQETVDTKLATVFELTYVGAQTSDKKIAEGEDGDDALKIICKDKVNFLLADADAYGDLIIGAAGSVLAIDDSKAVVTKAGKATVTFSQSRAVPQDVWQACVLPFDIDEIEDLSDAFGYAAVDLLDEDRTVGNEIHFSLKVTGGIPAGTPFLFKTNNNNNFNNAAFEGVMLANTADLKPVVVDEDTKVKFVGTFTGVDITTSGYRYLSKGTWYDTADGKAKPYVIKPLRAYLDLTEMVNASAARIFIEEPDGTVTAIDSITIEGNNAEGLYNLNGMKVNQGLKGVYIQNGKKVIKK